MIVGAPVRGPMLGAGLVTDPAVLVPAYDDAAGVTALRRNGAPVENKNMID